ncbi:MAG: tRNA1(Val) (adenine(37)-N6)-methyltransferase [Eubacterium sp.]|nr:tRNA1(Val) (adenine(37)-N6)-methyltransferase [Eubacterium sp.]
MSKDFAKKPDLLPGERLDDLQRDGLCLIQNPSWFCFGIDAVLLSHFAETKEGDLCLDLGTGNGIVPTLLYGRNPGGRFRGLEIQEDVADMARRSVEWNDIGHAVEILTGDIREACQIFPKASFDVVTSNPPYMTESHGLVGDQNHKAIARHEIMCKLEDLIREATGLLKPGGHFFMVHRPFRLAEIFDLMRKYKLEPKRMRLVCPYVDKEPNLVLVEGVRGGRARLKVEAPLIVYQEGGQYTEEIRKIYYE